MLQPLVILGAGGFARETQDIVYAINAHTQTFDLLGFIVDSQYGQAGDLINEKPILGDFSWFHANHNVSVVCGVGAPHQRFKMVERLADYNVTFATLIHPSAILTDRVKIGEGCIITAGCIITNEITFGNHVHLNLDCTVGHDATLQDYVTTAPGVHISGRVKIEKGSYIGTGTNIIESLSIGEWSIIGAGSTVIKNIPANVTAVGSPAKVIKSRAVGWHKQ